MLKRRMPQTPNGHGTDKSKQLGNNETNTLSHRRNNRWQENEVKNIPLKENKKAFGENNHSK